jgi:hypothetical protein
MSCRNNEICQLFRSGMAVTRIAPKFGVTRQRVQQILKRCGLTALDGGRSFVTALNGTADNRLKKRRADRFIDTYGCTRGQAWTLSTKGQRLSYRQQRRNAGVRGIPWEMTLISWLIVWESSGKLNDRGRGHGNFVMARRGDDGPYHPDNVEIVTADQNSADQWLWRRELPYKQRKPPMLGPRDPKSVVCGERHYSAVLTADQVNWIREQPRSKDMFKKMGAVFGVDNSTARKAYIGKTWKHLPMRSHNG